MDVEFPRVLNDPAVYLRGGSPAVQCLPGVLGPGHEVEARGGPLSRSRWGHPASLGPDGLSLHPPGEDGLGAGPGGHADETLFLPSPQVGSFVQYGHVVGLVCNKESFVRKRKLKFRQVPLLYLTKWNLWFFKIWTSRRKFEFLTEIFSLGKNHPFSSILF